MSERISRAIIFSPTGGTAKVCRLLADAWSVGPEVDLSRLTMPPATIDANDVCLIGMPVFGGRVPALAARRLGRLVGNGAPAVLVAVYGNRAYEDALVEMQDTAVGAGFVPVAAVAAVARHSIMTDVATERPDHADAATLHAFAAQIRARLQDWHGEGNLDVPGQRPYKNFPGVALRPETDRARCIFCGTCAALCPAGAIPKREPHLTDREQCIACMRCIHVCPVHARALPADDLVRTEAVFKPLCAGHKENTLFII